MKNVAQWDLLLGNFQILIGDFPNSEIQETHF